MDRRIGRLVDPPVNISELLEDGVGQFLDDVLTRVSPSLPHDRDTEGLSGVKDLLRPDSVVVGLVLVGIEGCLDLVALSALLQTSLDLALDRDEVLALEDPSRGDLRVVLGPEEHVHPDESEALEVVVDHLEPERLAVDLAGQILEGALHHHVHAMAGNQAAHLLVAELHVPVEGARELGASELEPARLGEDNSRLRGKERLVVDGPPGPAGALE